MSYLLNSKKISDFGLIPLIGAMGVYVYVVSFIFPVKWDFPMIALVASAIVSTLLAPQRMGIRNETHKKTRNKNRNKTRGTIGLADTHRINLLLMIFLVSMAVSTLVSKNLMRSVNVSITFLPALLIYFLIVEQFNSNREFLGLYFSFSLTALGISLAALYFAASNNFNLSNDFDAHAIAGSFSYIIVSRNDLTFLSILAPFSFILAYQKPFSPIGLLAFSSIVLSLGTIIIFQSRGATLTFLITIGTIAMILEPRKALWLALIATVLFVGIDGLLGFPLFRRFYGVAVGADELTHGRTDLWWIACNHFKEAPILGHGPHTFNLYSKVPWPHNLYLEVLFGQGLIGFSAFIILLIQSVITAWGLRLKSSEETRCLAMGAFAALIGFCVSSIIELTFLRLWVTVTLFMIVGIIVRLSSTRTTQMVNFNS